MAIYDALFTELRPSVLRLRNSYQQPTPYLTADQIMDIDRQFVEAAQGRLGDLTPRVLMSSWSPPAALKQSGTLTGGDSKAVLKKDKFGNFIYKEFANYWLEALKGYAARGVEPTWISMYAPWQRRRFACVRSGGDALTSRLLFLSCVVCAVKMNRTTTPAFTTSRSLMRPSRTTCRGTTRRSMSRTMCCTPTWSAVR